MKTTAALIVLFVLLGIAIPNLVDAHDTPLLLLAIVLGFVALGVAVWTFVSIRRSWRRLRRGVIELIEG
ncbi:MAG TPA: hypothetical protein VFE13_08390 [Caulobacteraceae bacterium]|nr:hypothetical protein [Caulobacteraceae bacterium]